MGIKGHIVDVVRREIFDGELIIEGEKIAEVKRCRLPSRRLRAWTYQSDCQACFGRRLRPVGCAAGRQRQCAEAL